MTRILLVEDEESFSDPLSYMLRKEGYEGSVAETGPDALADFDRSGADLVLLELMPATLESGPVRMDVERHTVTVNGAPIALPLKEFELLEILLRNSGRVLTRMQLIDRVWGSDYVGDTKTLDVHVKRLRAKVEPDPPNPQFIVTVRGLGYKFETP